MIRAPLVSALLAIGLAGLAQAQSTSYPERSIKLVVPFPAGGATDTSARLVAQAMSSRLGRAVVIENQSGAGGIIGARQVATANPDGYTLMMVAAANTFGTGPYLYKLDYDPLKAFVPVAMAVVERQVLVVTPSLPVKTLPELVQYESKSRQAELRFRYRYHPAFSAGAVPGSGPASTSCTFLSGRRAVITDLLAGRFK